MPSPAMTSKLIKAHLEKALEKRPELAIVYAVNHPAIDIHFPSSPSIIRNVEVIGGTANLAPGDMVQIIWVDRSGHFSPTPVAIAPGGGDASRDSVVLLPDNITLYNSPNGLAIKPRGIDLEHLNFSPSLEGHTHLDSLQRGGWQVSEDDGTIFAGETFIRPSGQIALGNGNDILKLDSNHESHYLWAGNIDPLLAPFSVQKDGSLQSTRGHIGGWQIGVESLTSDNGSVGMSVAEYGGEKWRFWAGGEPGNAPFQVNANGDVWLRSAFIEANLQSQNYIRGLRGWALDREGNFEAQNALIRGTIRSAVFSYQEENVVGGAWGLYKGGGKLEAPVVTDPDNPFEIVVKGSTFEVGDILYVKNGAISDNWIRVEAVEGQGETRTYTCVLVNGSQAAEYEAGSTVVNYGATNGFIRMRADNGLHLLMASHNGEPWDPTPHVWIGQLQGYGNEFTDPDDYGWAVGDPEGGDYAYYSSKKNKLSIAGEIKAHSGSIGGWGITDSAITGGGAILHKDGYLKVGSGSSAAFVASNNASWRIWAGSEDPGSANFKVGVDGKLFAVDANISGNIRAGSGDNAVYLSSTGTYRLWAGGAEADYAPFRVTQDGKIYVSRAGFFGGIRLDESGVTLPAQEQDLGSGSEELSYIKWLYYYPDQRTAITARIGADAPQYLLGKNVLRIQALPVTSVYGVPGVSEITLSATTIKLLTGTEVSGGLAVSGQITGASLQVSGQIKIGSTGNTTLYQSSNQLRTDSTFSAPTLRISDNYTVDLTADSVNRLRVPNQYTDGNHWIGALLKNRGDAWAAVSGYVPYYYRAINGETRAPGDLFLGPVQFGLHQDARPKAYVIRVIGHWLRDPNTADRLSVLGYIDGAWRYVGALWNYQEGFSDEGQFVVPPLASNGQIRLNFAGSNCNGLYVDCVGYYI